MKSNLINLALVLAVAVAGVSTAQAGKGGNGGGGSGSGNKVSMQSSQKSSMNSSSKNYSCYKGYCNHWSSSCYSSSYGCYTYWCPYASCYYYWYAPLQCYYPITYITVLPPTTTCAPCVTEPVATTSNYTVPVNVQVSSQVSQGPILANGPVGNQVLPVKGP